MTIRAVIEEMLSTTPIRVGQFDLNGKCNAKCWYCPVKYEDNPKAFQHQVSVADANTILRRLRESAHVSPDMKLMYTCHYNEALLHKDLEGILAAFRTHGMTTSLLSNGTPLTPEKADILTRYHDVAKSVLLNIPAFEPEDWSKKAGMHVRLHQNLMRNLRYVHDQTDLPLSIQINSVTDLQAASLGAAGILTSKSEADKISLQFKQEFPRFNIRALDSLSNRAGLLSRHGAFVEPPKSSRPVVGCAHTRIVPGARIYGWIHINSSGDLFLCCDDYQMKYRFGNIIETPLDQLWVSKAHIDAIETSFNELCRSCDARITAPPP